MDFFFGFVTCYVEKDKDGFWYPTSNKDSGYYASCFVLFFWIVWVGKPQKDEDKSA